MGMGKKSKMGPSGKKNQRQVSQHVGSFAPFFPPHIFREGLLKSQLRGLRERGRAHFLWRFLRIGPLYFCLPLYFCVQGEKWTEERERESGRQRDQCLTAAQTARKIKCFSFLLGSSRCAGMVTLATGKWSTT